MVHPIWYLQDMAIFLTELVNRQVLLLLMHHRFRIDIPKGFYLLRDNIQIRLWSYKI